MNYWLFTALYFSIIIPVIIGCIRIKRIDATYYPFLLCLAFGAVHEIASFILIQNQLSNTLIYNIYTLIEALLLTIQFKLWDKYGSRRLYVPLLALFLAVWTIENFWLRGISAYFNSYFIILYSFILVLLSISRVNVILTQVQHFSKNAVFLICCGLIIYFTYSAVIEIFWLYGFDEDQEFSARIYDILAFINLLVNLIFAFAILWIPRKQKFLLPSSPPVSS
jgi:hypothetical protein